MTQFSWTDERVVLLKSDWADGRTSGQIATDFGISRGAVIGKLNRLGLIGKLTPRQRSERIGRASRQWFADPGNRASFKHQMASQSHRAIVRAAWKRRKQREAEAHA